MTSPLTGEQLTALYDAENPWSVDDAFFLTVINELPSSQVLDLGCGTGRLTRAVAADGHHVVGIDPDAEALDAARRKPDAENIRWVHGTSTRIPDGVLFDTAIMTSHVAQAISDEAAWAQTLEGLHWALVPGGRLIFDSRDPAARVWERWTPANTRDTYTLPDGTTVETWIDCTVPRDGLALLTEHRLRRGREEETATLILSFRTETQLRQDLAVAGFTLEQVLSGWAGEVIGEGQGELIVIARKRS
ncbi:MAG: class I SAM-dependent methyltransferase [Arthrobacter sp.]|uniref:class I SAM-dependent methyltransferase n=1 Tax=unclassified Arthrobacter TaxID=235627 RepID=UPI00264D4B8A|nr:class I SAM-dependent methyltransferase [Micrococcaceae bacterium]MDN5812697.1 class I SAM-dependent methyltransferase [Micrococcaceae bacterium]MDN5823438.1 class I SAM-dependent methyltransferase [Micrococcaceae bacterium]MDN5878844.1 class I SAM-dependent methyltransferase [Micrococcaceae bacterium]MDN5905730.1 class I SAM-dependent methyltransferase [Micrococcaceae bacterium]